jgi:DNA-binding PadR family transcriptional regulator
MPKGTQLGEFEHLILLALLRLGADAYGVGIRQEIEDRTGRPVTTGAVYVTLDRLEGKGLVESWTGEATAERGGKAKRYFRATPAGLEALRESRQALERMAEGVSLA